MPHNRVIALWIPVVSLLLGIVGALYVPSLILGIQETVTLIDSLNRDITSLDSDIAELESFESTYQALSDSVAKVETALPHSNDYPTLLNELEQIAVISGIILREVNFTELKRSRKGERVLPDGVNAFFVDVELTGSYGAFRHFLRQLEGELRIMDVQSIELTRQQGRLGTVLDLDTELSINNYSLQVLTYFQDTE